MRRLSLSVLAVVAGLSTAHAQQRHNATAPAHHNNAAPQMHVPNNTVHFPNNTAYFPNNTGYFPNNTVHFPNNGGLNFPSYNSIVGSGFGMNFPNNTVNFPSYNSAIYAHVTPYNTGSFAHQGLPANQAAAMMGMPIGVGGITTSVAHHAHPSHHSYRRPTTHARSVAAYRTNSGVMNQMTPTQRHYIKVVHDLDSLTPGFSVADTHRRMFANDLMALSETNPRPSAATVQHLSNSLANAMVHRRNPTFNTAMLADGLRASMNAGHLPPSDVNQAVGRTRTLLKEAGFHGDAVQTILANLNAVVADARAGRPR